MVFSYLQSLIRLKFLVLNFDIEVLFTHCFHCKLSDSFSTEQKVFSLVWNCSIFLQEHMTLEIRLSLSKPTRTIITLMQLVKIDQFSSELYMFICVYVHYLAGYCNWMSFELTWEFNKSVAWNCVCWGFTISTKSCSCVLEPLEFYHQKSK